MFIGSMNPEILLLFPHQLFPANRLPVAQLPVVLLEENLFFTEFHFHPHKLIFHRSSMKVYAAELQPLRKVFYQENNGSDTDIRNWLPQQAGDGLQRVHYIDPADDWLERRLKKAARQHHVELTRHESPAFLNSISSCDDFFARQKKYFQADFYTWQRKSRKLLLQDDGKPLGGKWSFDADNRQKIPARHVLPDIPLMQAAPEVIAAERWVTKSFPWPYSSPAPFGYPVSRIDAQDWLKRFLNERLDNFGAYEDAMVRDESLLYHSLLSPLLNAGLLLPQDVLDQTLEAASNRAIPLNSLEGFVRQLIGWREFVRQVYARAGRQQRTKNYWGFTRKIPRSFWEGNTGLPPFDTVVQRVLRTGYCHHIERLMVLGNLMLLCEFDPDEVYRWFMELFIDAYDWVMVPNVYGMSQCADGGLMTTKPYISGSNYLMKMGNWEKGDWQSVWDGLFWRFMHVHRDFFLQNPRLGMLVGTFDKMPAERQQMHLKNADHFLSSL